MPSIANSSGGWLNRPAWMSEDRYGIVFPEDSENQDKSIIIEKFNRFAEEYFSSTYPDFEPEIIVGDTKEYWLPALKVLKFYNGQFISPGYESIWNNMELKAECRSPELPSYPWNPEPEGKSRHDAPHNGCDCGIYGSVNMEEIHEYLHKDYSLIQTIHNQGRRHKVVDPYFEQYAVRSRNNPRAVLCIIEPSPDAKVIRARKGWKASHAFISEIIGETMSDAEASSLLSIAWHRNIDLRGLYENR